VAFTLPGYFGPGGTILRSVPSIPATSNAREVIQSALDAGKGAPTVVWLQGDTYTVWPEAGKSYPGNNCLEIRYSNVALVGAWRGGTTISCKVAGGRDPNSNWEVLSGKVWRGNGIALVGATISNVSIRGVRLTGNSPRDLATRPVWGPGTPSGESFPANVGTGDGWDITNKGVMVGDGTTRTNVTIEDCEIDSFRGECVYYGGSSGNQNMLVRRSVVHGSIASLLSCSGRVTYEDNELYYGLNAVENTPIADTQIIRRNWVHDCPHGITLASNAAPPANGAGRAIIAENRITKSYIWAMYIQGAIRGVWVHDNEVVDCPNYGGMLMGGPGVGGTGPQDITLERNLYRLESYAGNVVAIGANSDTGYPVSYRIIGNRSERSAWAKAQGYTIAGVVKASNEPTSTIYESGNDWSDGG